MKVCGQNPGPPTPQSDMLLTELCGQLIVGVTLSLFNFCSSITYNVQRQTCHENIPKWYYVTLLSLPLDTGHHRLTGISENIWSVDNKIRETMKNRNQ